MFQSQFLNKLLYVHQEKIFYYYDIVNQNQIMTKHCNFNIYSLVRYKYNISKKKINFNCP